MNHGVERLLGPSLAGTRCHARSSTRLPAPASAAQPKEFRRLALLAPDALVRIDVRGAGRGAIVDNECKQACARIDRMQFVFR